MCLQNSYLHEICKFADAEGYSWSLQNCTAEVNFYLKCPPLAVILNYIGTLVWYLPFGWLFTFCISSTESIEGSLHTESHDFTLLLNAKGKRGFICSREVPIGLERYRHYWQSNYQTNKTDRKETAALMTQKALSHMLLDFEIVRNDSKFLRKYNIKAIFMRQNWIFPMYTVWWWTLLVFSYVSGIVPYAHQPTLIGKRTVFVIIIWEHTPDGTLPLPTSGTISWDLSEQTIMQVSYPPQ